MSALKLLRPCIFLLMTLVFLACQSTTDQTSEEEQVVEEPVYTGARLVQVDSIMIDLIGNFKVYDYQPESNLFLGGDIGNFGIYIGPAPPSNEIGHVVFNRKGEILHQFNHTDSGPEGHSSGAYDHSFLGANDIGVMSKKALYRYGIDGSYKGKYPDLNTLDLAGFSGQPMLFALDGDHVALGLPKGMEAAKRAWDSLYQIVKPLWFYELAPGETQISTFKAKQAYPDHPIYYPESKMNTSVFPPLMTVNRVKNELYAVYPAIPKIYIYDMLSGQAKGEIDLSPDNFEVETEVGHAPGGVEGYGGLLWLNKGGRMANARYQQLTQLGEYTLMRYSPALPSSIIKDLVSSPGMLSKKEDWPSIRKKYGQFQYQLFKDGQKVLSDFELPLLEPKRGHLEMNNDRATRGHIIGGNGLDEIFIFIPNDGDVERDYELIRVYKLELTTD